MQFTRCQTLLIITNKITHILQINYSIITIQLLVFLNKKKNNLNGNCVVNYSSNYFFETEKKKIYDSTNCLFFLLFVRNETEKKERIIQFGCPHTRSHNKTESEFFSNFVIYINTTYTHTHTAQHIEQKSPTHISHKQRGWDIQKQIFLFIARDRTTISFPVNCAVAAVSSLTHTQRCQLSRSVNRTL